MDLVSIRCQIYTCSYLCISGKLEGKTVKLPSILSRENSATVGQKYGEKNVESGVFGSEHSFFIIRLTYPPEGLKLGSVLEMANGDICFTSINLESNTLFSDRYIIVIFFSNFCF